MTLKETSLGWNHFQLPWLWKDEYPQLNLFQSNIDLKNLNTSNDIQTKRGKRNQPSNFETKMAEGAILLYNIDS